MLRYNTIHAPLDIELYQKALSQGFERDRSIRVNVVGNYNQGKTSLTKALIGQETTSLQSTNSVEISHCKFTNTNGEVKVFLKNSPDSDSDIDLRIASLVQIEKEGAKSLPDRESMTVGMEDKKSLETTREIKMVEDKEFQNIAKLLQENEGKKSEGDGNLQIWDFGGQFIFYATHTLFHSKRSIYLLVFDLTKHLSDVIDDPEFPEESVGKNIQQYAEYWMNSIHSYVGSDDGLEPPVILVGTHADKLKGDENMKEKLKDEYFDKIRELFDDSLIIKHIQTKDFAINCTNPNDISIAALRKEIVCLGSNFKEEIVPARWIRLEKALLAIKHKRVIPYSEVVAIDSKNEFPLKDKENIRLFLLYHHVKGNLFYYDEEPISAYVVLDTQYLIDAFRCIVTSKRFLKKDTAYRDLWKSLQQEARLEMKLIERVWNEDNGFLEHKEELLMFLERHFIISEAKSYDEQTEETLGLGWFLVPCFLREHSSNDVLENFLNGRQQTKLRFAMSFYFSTVVQIVYYRLVAALIGKWSVVSVHISKKERKLLLYENLGVFRLNTDHVGIVELNQSIIDLRVLTLCSSSSMNAAVVDMFRRFVVSNVMSEFGKLRRAKLEQDKPFEICFKCNHESHFLDGSIKTISLEKLKETKVEPCPDMLSGHDIVTKFALPEWYQDDHKIELANDCELEDRQLSKLSENIGKNWELLGIELGLKEVQIEKISADNQSTDMRIFKMLRKWVKKEEETATINALLKAMKSTKGLSVEWDDVRNIVEEIASKH